MDVIECIHVVIHREPISIFIRFSILFNPPFSLAFSKWCEPLKLGVLKHPALCILVLRNIPIIQRQWILPFIQITWQLFIHTYCLAWHESSCRRAAMFQVWVCPLTRAASMMGCFVIKFMQWKNVPSQKNVEGTWRPIRCSHLGNSFSIHLMISSWKKRSFLSGNKRILF